MSLIQSWLGKPVPLEIDGIIFHARYMNGREAMRYASLQRLIRDSKTRSIRNRTPEDTVTEADELFEANLKLLEDRLTRIDNWGPKPITKKAEMRKVLEALPATQLEELTIALSDVRQLERLLFRGELVPGDPGGKGGEEPSATGGA